MKHHKSLKETMHRRTYNLVSKNLYARCCRCPWHGNFWTTCWDIRYSYLEYCEDGTDKPEKLKYRDHPNWKLVSKNPKQWMKKKFIKVREDYVDGSFHISFGW
ncbi:hypothetical protein [Chitinophaga sp.]|uniref:hypothetical protein n=1 Tax=Chitinophaga sp. TaxID=1869181 RepID=UPI0031DA5D33